MHGEEQQASFFFAQLAARHVAQGNSIKATMLNSLLSSFFMLVLSSHGPTQKSQLWTCLRVRFCFFVCCFVGGCLHTLYCNNKNNKF